MVLKTFLEEGISAASDAGTRLVLQAGLKVVARLQHLRPRLDLEVFKYPNIFREIRLDYDDEDDIEDDEGDIDSVDDKQSIPTPFDWAKMRRHYVAYVGHSPKQVTKGCLNRLFKDKGVVHVEIVRAKERSGGVFAKDTNTEGKMSESGFECFCVRLF